MEIKRKKGKLQNEQNAADQETGSSRWSEQDKHGYSWSGEGMQSTTFPGVCWRQE